MVNKENPKTAWTFLSNHAHVLLCIVDSPQIRLRDIAEKVGITERAVQKNISDLLETGYLNKKKDGRRNKYIVNKKKMLRHPVEKGSNVADLIKLIY